MDEYLMFLSFSVVCGVGFALGTVGIAFCGVIIIKIIAWGEYKLLGGRRAKKTTVRCSKDGANGDAGGVLPPEK